MSTPRPGGDPDRPDAAHPAVDGRATDDDARLTDDVDLIQEAWARERPDLPLRSIGVLTRIRRIAKILEDDRRRTMAALGMEPAIRDLLATLRRAGPPYRLRASDLADRCRVSRGAITQRVDRAEADGLVRRAPGEESGGSRAVWVELTPAGRELVERTVAELLAHEDAIVAGLGDEEITTLADSLRRFLRLLDEEPPGAVGPDDAATVPSGTVVSDSR